MQTLTNGMQTDYYSEYIPADEEEEEILESLPEIKEVKIIENTGLTEPDTYGYIIEENNNNRLVSLNSDFETKIQNKILYSTLKENDSSNKALRFKLLENELRALMIDIDEDADDTNAHLKKRIDTLMNDISDFKKNQAQNTFLNYWDDKLNNFSDAKTDVSSTTVKNISVAPTAISIIDLESRIASLEKQFNITGPLSYEVSIPKLIEDLNVKTSLILDGGMSMDAIKSEISKLTANCKMYIQNSKKIKDKSEIVPLTDKKLALLYKKIKNLPEIDILISTILGRLESLNQVIIETSHNADFINGLNTEFNMIENKLDSWDTQLDELETQLLRDRKVFDEFKKSLK